MTQIPTITGGSLATAPRSTCHIIHSKFASVPTPHTLLEVRNSICPTPHHQNHHHRRWISITMRIHSPTCVFYPPPSRCRRCEPGSTTKTTRRRLERRPPTKKRAQSLSDFHFKRTEELNVCIMQPDGDPTVQKSVT